MRGFEHLTPLPLATAGSCCSPHSGGGHGKPVQLKAGGMNIGEIKAGAMKAGEDKAFEDKAAEVKAAEVASATAKATDVVAANVVAAEGTEFSLEGLTCGHCVQTVEKAVTRVEGVEAASVELVPSGRSRLVIAGTPDEAVINHINQAVTAAGYTLISH
jgi:copper chaperone